MALHYIVPALLTAQLLRTCPKCSAKQLAKMSEVGQQISCKRCGAAIAPPKR